MKAGFLLLSSLILGLSSPLSVFAEPNAAQMYFINQNNTNFYDPTGSDDCSDYVGSSYNGETSGHLAQNYVAWVVRWHSLVEKLSIEFGIPWETAMAQSILESRGETSGIPGQSNVALTRNNFHGINVYPGSPGFAYTDAANGWVGYFDNVARTSTYRNHGAFSTDSPYGNAVTDPYAYLQAVAYAGYAGDYVNTYISANAPLVSDVLKFAEEQGWPTSSELAAKHPEMLENASRTAVLA